MLIFPQSLQLCLIVRFHLLGSLNFKDKTMKWIETIENVMHIILANVIKSRNRDIISVVNLCTNQGVQLVKQDYFISVG